MGHRERVDRCMDAIREGREARRRGEPRGANPYKEPNYGGERPTGIWSLHPFWALGWDDADVEAGR